jgi:hypothetical protein
MGNSHCCATEAEKQDEVEANKGNGRLGSFPPEIEKRTTNIVMETFKN